MLSLVIKEATKRPISTLMLFLTILFFGIIASLKIPIDYIPAMDIPKLVVSTSFPGYPANEVRDLVTMPLEDTFSSVKGIKNISSVSREGLSSIELEFSWGFDMLLAAVETREMIDIAYQILPSDASKPLVLPIDPNNKPLVTCSINSSTLSLDQVRNTVEYEIKPLLQQIDGVSSVNIIGGMKDELHINTDVNALLSRGLTLQAISNSLKQSNVNYPAGLLEFDKEEYIIYSNGRADSIKQLRNLPIQTKNGKSFPLGEVSSIFLSTNDEKSFFYHNNDKSIGIEIRRMSKVNPVALSNKIQRWIEDNSSLYENVDINIVNDQSVVIIKNFKDILYAALSGMIISFLVLLFFSRNVRSSLILSTSIPTSIMITIPIIFALDRTLNIMSMGGIAIGIGMLVDNSVVVLDSIKRKVQDKICTPENVANATIQVSSSILSSTITTVVVFIPILFLPGILGSLYGDLALTISISLLSSFVVSITLVPVLFLLLYKDQEIKSHSSYHKNDHYKSILTALTRNRVKAVTLIILVILLPSLLLPIVKKEYYPFVNEGIIDVFFQLPPDSSNEHITDAMKDIAASLDSVSEIIDIYLRAGGEANDIYYLSNPLLSKEQIHGKLHFNSEEIKIDILLSRLEKMFPEYSNFAFSLPENPLTPLLGIKPNRNSFYLFPSSSVSTTDQVNSINERISGQTVSKINVYPPSTIKSYTIKPDFNKQALLEFPSDNIIPFVHSLINGVYSTKYNHDGRLIDIKIKDNSFMDCPPSQIGNFPLVYDDTHMKLKSIVNINDNFSLPYFLRHNRKDYIQLEGPTNFSTSLINNKLIDNSTIQIKSLDQSAFSEHGKSIIATFVFSIVLIFLVLTIKFESLPLSFFTVSLIPFSLSGVVFSLLLFDHSINLNSAIGLLVLIGLIVNNTILLFESYESNTTSACTVKDIIENSILRYRPIMITTYTTSLALLPLAIDYEKQSAQSSLAAVIIGGLMLSTIISLFLTPLIYLSYKKIRC